MRTDVPLIVRYIRNSVGFAGVKGAKVAPLLPFRAFPPPPPPQDPSQPTQQPMGNKREPSLNHQWSVDPTPMPAHVPDVEEVGATSAPLLSAAFFIGARCTPYNDDFMQCREEAKSGEVDCLKEGRRVTRCASSVIADLNKSCAESFRLHWQCLENNNHELFKCRKAETLLSKCAFDMLKLEKRIPGASEQIHLKEKPLYKPNVEDRPSLKAYKVAEKEGRL